MQRKIGKYFSDGESGYVRFLKSKNPAKQHSAVNS